MAALYLIARARSVPLTKQDRTLIFLGILWSCAQALSDIYNHTAFIDAAKGIISPLLFVLTTIGLASYFRGDIARIPLFVLGAVVGNVANLLFFPTTYFPLNPWKWGLGSAALTIFALYYSFFLKYRSKAFLIGVITLFTVITLLLGARSMAVLPLIAAIAYSKFGARPTKSSVARFLSGRWGATKILLILAPTLIVANFLASQLFSSSFVLSRLPHAAAVKYRIQASGTYGILLGGRTEILVSSRAFADKPFLGHGSWAKDNGGYVDQYAELRREYGYAFRSESAESIDDGRIPTHSFLMQAAVWSGFAGAIFWLYVLRSSLISFISMMHRLPFYFYTGMATMIWAILFSPFGAITRWATALFFAAYLAYIYALQVRAAHK